MASLESIRKLSDYEQKKYSVGGAFSEYIKNCTVSLSPICSAEISDEIVKCFEIILDRKKFGKLSKNEQFGVFDRLSEEMSDYVGVGKAKLDLKVVDDVKSNLLGVEYMFISKFMSYDEKIRFLSQNLNNGDYANSNLDNKLIFYYYSNQYYSQVKKEYRLNDKELQDIMTDEAILSSMRHEYQHFFQFAKIRRFLSGDSNVEERYKIMALYSIMQLSLMKYIHINGVDKLRISNINYFTDLFEIDARLSELSFLKKLISDERVSKETKNKLNKFATYYVRYNFKFEDKVKFSKLVEQNLKNTKANFEKVFGELPIAQEVLKAFEMCNLDRFYTSIDRRKDMCMKAFAVDKDKEICKEI